MRARAFSGLLAVALSMLAPCAAATDYPQRPIKLVVPFPPGGGADKLARTIMPKVEALLGQPIVIDNRPGAGGNLGAEFVARAEPDGYTLLYGTNGTHPILNAAIRNALRDPAIVEALHRLGAQPVTSTPEEFALHISTSTAKWAAVVQASGAKVD